MLIHMFGGVKLMPTYENIDFKFEAISLMNKVIQNKNDDEKIFENYLSYGLDSKVVNELFQNYNQFKESVLSEVGEITSKEQVYFEKLSKNELPFLISFYNFYKYQDDKSFPACLDNFFQLYLEELINEQVKEINLSILISKLKEFDLPDRNQLLLINFYNDGEKIFQELMEEVNQVARVIESKYDIIKDDIEKFIEKLKQMPDITNQINNLLGGSLLLNDDYSLHIMIFSYNQMTINNYDNAGYHVYLGYLLFKMMELKETNVYEEKRLLNMLKAISDPTRFKILKLLKEKNMYNQEIAKEIGLTTATLAHHLDILLNEGIIGVEISQEDKRRIYYSLRPKALKIITSTLERIL